MAQRGQKDLLGKLADKGEEAISKLADVPAADRVLNAASGMGKRLDEIQKRVRGLESLEKRVAALERRVDKLAEATGSTKRRATPAERSATARKKTTSTTRRKPSSS
jgi:biopolymer transport protein ExbB/TolQ